MGLLTSRVVAIAADAVNDVGLLTFCSPFTTVVYQPVYGRVLFTGYSVRFE